MIMIMLTPLPLNEKIPTLLTLLLMITVYQLILLDSLPASEEVSIAGVIIQGVFKTAGLLTFTALLMQIFT